MLQIQARKCCFASLANFSTFKNPSTTSKKPSSSSSSSSSASLIKPITVHVGAGNQLHYPKLQSLHPNIPYPLKLVPTEEGEEGVKLTVQVADSANDRKHLVKNRSTFDQTVVALHGTPGYLQHFDALFAEYQHRKKSNSSRSVRLIAPNFPDFSHTRSTGGLFWHTTEEKVAFLRDLLFSRLQVTTIDCLVAHSAGAQTALALAEDPGPQLKIRSIALLSPQPMLDPVAPAVRAAARRLFRLASLTGKNGADIFYRLLSAAQLHRLIKSAYKFATTDELLWALTTLLDLQTPLSVQRRVKEMVQKSSSVPHFAFARHAQATVRMIDCLLKTAAQDTA